MATPPTPTALLPTVLYVVVPLATNSLLAFGAYVAMPEAFTDSLLTCYFIAALAALAAFVSVGGFFLHDIGPTRTVGSLIMQAATLVFVFAGIYRGFGLANAAPIVDYEISLYFSVVTWTTLGYGDFVPGQGLRLIAAFQAGLGYLFLGLIVGMAADILSKRTNTG